MPAFALYHRISCLSLLLCLMLSGMPTQAAIASRNYNPFALMVGLPELKSGFLPEANRVALSVTSTLSNQWNVDAVGDETLFMDGEVNITDVTISYGLNALELQVNIPFIAYQQGSLDPLVEGFHNTFSMPNGGRELFYQDQLLFVYSNDKTDQTLRLDDSVEGLGDVRLLLRGQIQRHANFASSVGLQLKLANAKQSSWLGSGSYDLALLNSYEWHFERWQTQFQWGAVWMQDKGFLAGQRKKLAGTLSAAMNYAMTEHLWWTLQYDGHSALFDKTRLAPMSRGSMAAMALSWREIHWQGYVAILEDVAVASAPDVGFQLGLKVHW